jgi:PhoPQ-activated pathogenicity-related protein
MLNVTSGRWMTPQYSNRYIWSHQLLIVVPDTILDYTHGALYITGGSNGQGNPDVFSEDVLFCDVLASATGTICGVLWQIPNQEITFPSDPYQPPRHRSEDAAVAFTWWDFAVNHPNEPERILYFPMTRAASRAMDAMTEWASAHVPGANLSKFLVSGASKRGFITWFTAGVDDRVIAAAPIVMDLLNTTANINHLYQDFGGFSFAFQDYCDMNLTEYLNTPTFVPLAKIIDPLTYKENLTMPKLVIDATGDEFFALDDDYYWWGDLPGETKRLMVANAEHSFATGVIPLITGLDAFWQSIIDGTPRPELTWSIADSSGTIELVTPTLPDQVVMRFSQTLNGKRRDFRLVRGDTPADPCVSPGIPVKIFGDGECSRSTHVCSIMPASQRASCPSSGSERTSDGPRRTMQATTSSWKCPPPRSAGVDSWPRRTGAALATPPLSSPRRSPSSPRPCRTRLAPPARACWCD